MCVSRWSGSGLVGSLLAFTGGVCPAAEASNPPPNIVIESFEFLPVISGQSSLRVVSVNNRGDFCGRRGGGTSIQAFRYLGNTPRPGGFSLLYNDINDAQDTVGNTAFISPPSAVLVLGFMDLFRSGYLYHSINNSGWIAAQRSTGFGPQPFVRLDDLGETELPLGPFWRHIDDDGRVWGTTFAGDIEQVVVKTRFGPVQNLGSFGNDGAKVTNVNRRGDWAGHTYSNASNFPPTIGLAIVGDVEHQIVSETGNDARALAVTLDGQIIGTDFGLCTPECDGKVWVIKDGVRHNIDDEISATLGFFPTLWNAQAASEHGWIIGQATDPRTNTFHFFRMKIQVDIDSDGDGMLDFWESENGGIDGNGDGVIDFRPFDLGARPDHKDLFVEVDAGEIPLGDAEVSMLLFAFDNAPVDNPDGTTGIRLHILRDETNLPFPDTRVFGTNFPEGFEATKRDHFGTPAERANSNRAGILAAKAKVFRYCVVYDGLEHQTTEGRYNGVAEINGNDFVVDFRAAIFNDGFRDADDRAATFMHELGHCLGLRHGGRVDEADNVGNTISYQCKPNYPSVMNYALSHPMRWSTKFWTLDYSREQLPILRESSLDEDAGIASVLYRNYAMPFGVGSELNRQFRLAKLDGRRVDFDGDGSFGVSSEDLNFLPASALIAGTTTASPGQTLQGQNDWMNLNYKVNVDGKERAADVTISEGCPDSESIAAFDAAVPVPCDADFNGDGLVDDADFQVFVIAYDKLVCVEPGGGDNRSASTAADCPCDLNIDRVVDDLDFQIFVVAYNELLCP